MPLDKLWRCGRHCDHHDHNDNDAVVVVEWVVVLFVE
jgi:hypothetical protein